MNHSSLEPQLSFPWPFTNICLIRKNHPLQIIVDISLIVGVEGKRNKTKLKKSSQHEKHKKVENEADSFNITLIYLHQ